VNLAGNGVVATDFSEVMEVKFSGAIGPLGIRRLCKIKCIGGEWVGPLCQVKDGELPSQDKIPRIFIMNEYDQKLALPFTWSLFVCFG